ncbi:MAG: hypothetical protein J5808_07250 [Paludibacteraceae bacterium]|nr:hypothetical protein [Paludibacteraceae bacterium]
MARVTFKPDQPVQALSGTYGNAVFRTLPSGQTVVSFRPLGDDNLPRPQRVIERCTADIQVAMGDMREAIDQREAIKKRVGTLYGRLYSLTDNDEQLRKYILQAYYNTRRKLPSRAKTADFVGVLS